MKQRSLSTKFFFVLLVLVAGLVVVGGMSAYSIQKIAQDGRTLVTVIAQRVIIAEKLEMQSYALRNLEKAFILSKTEQEMLKFGREIDQAREKALAYIGEYESIAGEQGRADVATLKAKLAAWQVENNKVRGLSLSGDNEAAATLAMGKNRLILDEFGAILEGMVARNQERLVAEVAVNDRIAHQTLIVNLGISIAVVVAGLLLGWTIMRRLSREIDDVINRLTGNSVNVSTAAKQIAASSEELSQAASEQAASLQETSASIEEMSSMVQKNSENSSRTSNVATTSRAGAERGKQVVNEMISAINEINQSNERILVQVDESNQQLSEIVKVIAEIGTKTKVINDIVFQTKLLSFNASVEAARAGEHGKGFAVVAEEVGNLAQMSGNAAIEISQMLESSIKRVEGMAEGMKSSIGRLVHDARDKVGVGDRIAKQCGTTLDEIVEQIASVAQMAEEISSASREQAQGVTEINKAIAQLDQVTQTNASASEQTAGSAEALARQAHDLQDVVSDLVRVIRGSSAGIEDPSQNRTRKSGSAQTPTQLDEARERKKEKAQERTILSSPPVKKAVASGDLVVPSESDSRFQDF